MGEAAAWEFRERPAHLACEGCGGRPLCGLVSPDGQRMFCVWCGEKREAPACFPPDYRPLFGAGHADAHVLRPLGARWDGQCGWWIRAEKAPEANALLALLKSDNGDGGKR